MYFVPVEHGLAKTSQSNINPLIPSSVRGVTQSLTASNAHDKAIPGLLEELIKREFCHQETEAKMIYTLT